MNNSPVRLLVIHDDDDDLVLTRGLLADIDCLKIELECVQTYEAGRHSLLHKAYDVCLLEHRLIGHNGLDFMKHVIAQGCRTPIILLTGQSDRAVNIEALKAGAADYLTRGRMDAQLLERSIRFAIERRLAAEALRASHGALETHVAERTVELEQANALLAEADRRKDEFLAMLAHELRNPLAALAAAVELVVIHDGDQANRERIVGVLDRQVRQLAHLVDDLLDVARIMRGKIQLRKQPADLKDVVAQAIETARPLLNSHRHQLHVALPAHSLPVEADASRLTQVFANLLNNAAKFTSDGGDVWITAELAVPQGDAESALDEGEPETAAVLVRVRDNGIGMEEELVPRVFDLFVQASNGSDRSSGGLGVGLTLVRRLVRLHGGAIWAHSDGPGRGSEFVVRLPLLSPVSAVADPAAGAPAGPEVRPARRLLVVEDNVDTAEMLAKLLRHLGQEVRTAHDGPGALAAALSFHPDIILLDIGLPGTTGFEVAAQLRQQPGMDKTLLVALTGYSQEEDRVRSMDAGFDHFLIKPVGLKTLEKLVVDPTSLGEKSS